MPQDRPRVLISLPDQIAVYREAVLGVLDYAEANGPWRMSYEGYDEAVLAQFAEKYPQYDGVIGCNWHMKHLSRVGWAERPLVAIGDEPEGYPSVGSDNPAIGRLAHAHLAERGLTSFAVLGAPGVRFSDERTEAFIAAATAAGHTVTVYEANVFPSISSFPEPFALLQGWIQALPVPTGLFGITAQRALEGQLAVQALGRRVPDDHPVLGVSVNEIEVRVATPRLSAIDESAYRWGWRAAKLLDRRLRGEPVRVGHRRLPPAGLVAGPSTNTQVVDDPAMAEVIRFIREHACSGVQIDAIAGATGFSRRDLQRRFSTTFGRTVHSELLRTRIDRAKHLLRTTQLPMVDLTERCGFTSRGGFAAAFKRATGKSPTAYRAEARRSGG